MAPSTLTLLVLGLALPSMACRGGEASRADCLAVSHTPIAELEDFAAVSRCSGLFLAPCRDALRRVDHDTPIKDRVAVVAACASAYCPMKDEPLCDLEHLPRGQVNAATQSLFRRALACPAADRDCEAVALALCIEVLRGKASVVRLSADGNDQVRAELAGTSTSLSLRSDSADLFAPVVAAAHAELAEISGLLVWGSELLPAALRTKLAAALSRADIDSVFCVPDGSNCR